METISGRKPTARSTIKVVKSHFGNLILCVLCSARRGPWLRRAAKCPIERKIYLSSSPFFFYWLSSKQEFAWRRWLLIYFHSCHPIILRRPHISGRNFNTRTRLGRDFFNNNLMTLCVWKCIYSTWRVERRRRSIRNRITLVCAFSPFASSIKCNRTTILDANGELLQYLHTFGAQLCAANDNILCVISSCKHESRTSETYDAAALAGAEILIKCTSFDRYVRQQLESWTSLRAGDIAFECWM